MVCALTVIFCLLTCIVPYVPEVALSCQMLFEKPLPGASTVSALSCALGSGTSAVAQGQPIFTHIDLASLSAAAKQTGMETLKPIIALFVSSSLQSIGNYQSRPSPSMSPSKSKAPQLQNIRPTLYLRREIRNTMNAGWPPPKIMHDTRVRFPAALDVYCSASRSVDVTPPHVYCGTSLDSLNPSYSGRTPLPIRGKAMYYNPGVMEQVVTYRLSLGQITPCNECVGYVALLRLGDLNRRVWIQWADNVEGPFLVVDVAAKQHVGALLRQGWAVDLDYQSAVRRGLDGPEPVTIWGTEPVSPSPALVATDNVAAQNR